MSIFGRKKVPLNTENRQSPSDVYSYKFEVGQYVYYTGLNNYIPEPRVIISRKVEFATGTCVYTLGHGIGRDFPTDTVTKYEYDLTLINEADPVYSVGDYVLVEDTVAYIKEVYRPWLQDIEYTVHGYELYTVKESRIHPFELSKGVAPYYDERTGLPALPFGFNIEIVDGGFKDETSIRTLRMYLLFRGEVIHTIEDIGELERNNGMYYDSLRVEVTAERVYMCSMVMRLKALDFAEKQEQVDREMRFIAIYPPASIKEIK